MHFINSRFSRHTRKVILALVLIASLAVPMVLGVALAQSPEDCDSNCAYADLGKDKPAVHQGEVINYTATVGNPRLGCEIGCDYMGVNVTLTLPDGTPVTLDTAQDFPAVPPTETTYPPEAYIVAVNEAINGGVHVVQTITAVIEAHGTLIDVPGGTECTTVSKPLSVNVLWPDVEVTKDPDTDLSKPGDTICYTIRVTNTGEEMLYKDTIIDTLLGDITADFAETLDPGLSDTGNSPYCYTVQHGDPNPLVNEVEVVYHDYTLEVGVSTAEFAEVSDTASAEVDLVHPDLLITKTGDERSKPGDVVTYEFYIENTGDCTLNRQSVNDTVLGDITADFPATLDPGDSTTVTKTREVLPGDPDPLENTVTAIYVVPELGNAIERTADHSVDLVDPDLLITKTGDELSKPGDVVTYEFYIENTGDCTLNRQSVNDTVLGDITANFPATLGPGDSTTVTKTREVLPGDPNPLVNTVTAIYVVPELGNRITATGGPHSVDLVHPELDVTKTADPPVAEVGDTITYTIEVKNTSPDTDLILVSVVDDLLGDLTASFTISTLGPGDSESHDFYRDVQAGDSDPLRNCVTATYEVPELGNRIEDTDCASVRIGGLTPTLTQWGIIGMVALFLSALVVLGLRQRRRISSS